MRIHVTAIQNRYLRRAAMIVAPLALYPIIVVLGALKGALDLTESLHGSWRSAWRGEPGDAECARVGVRAGQLLISMPIDLLAFAAEHGPRQNSHDPDSVRVEDRFRVTDQKVFAESVGRAIRAELAEDGTTLLHQMFDDAIGRVVEDGEEGFVWPAAGMEED